MGKHYVPQFLLKGFTCGNTLWVFDKERNIWFSSQPKSVANEQNLWPDGVETFVTDTIEEPAKAAITRLRTRDRLSEEDKRQLARYIAFLIKRVPAGRDLFYTRVPNVGERIRQELTAKLIRPEQRHSANRYIDQLLNERPAALWHGSVTTPTSEKMISTLTSMDWEILHTDTPQLLSSDNPVHYFKSTGLSNHKAELCLAFSSTVALVARRTGVPGARHRDATPNQIREINRRAVFNASRFIFCQTQEEWMDKFVKKRHTPLPGI